MKCEFRRVVAKIRAALTLAGCVILLFTLQARPTFAVEPLKVGLSLPMSGAAEESKQILIALELWRDDVNRKGGLLGRPVELVHYDDENNPAKVPPIYYRLFTQDKVDLTLGPYGTVASAAVMRVLANFNKTTITFFGSGSNRIFNSSKLFTMDPKGSAGVKALSDGFFELASQQRPRPQTVAILAADSDITKSTAEAAKTDASSRGFSVVYNKRYPIGTIDFSATLREVRAKNPDIVFISTSPAETVNVVSTAVRMGLKPKMFGGALAGLQATRVKTLLGPMLDGIVNSESLIALDAVKAPALTDLMTRYRVAADHGVDPLGSPLVPFVYASGEVLAQAVEGTKSVDQDRLAEYMHGHTFKTVVGDVNFNSSGELEKSRMVLTQFQHVSGSGGDQFADGKVQSIVWPDQFRKASFIYPYEGAKQ